ncbi:hypothetical protein [Mariniblastus fucicola]|uniref:Uncharacterized protein n=1 Tax=Mariniblastus fucicola TaxID=980251 RepID=A0A5B9PES7_9BACT|nr:hypothetical protein [Mariniblastus fucicola]QEG24918.1 hypothetical protein MFFC18_48410 [Mariniblastus fucicola]
MPYSPTSGTFIGTSIAFYVVRFLIRKCETGIMTLTNSIAAKPIHAIMNNQENNTTDSTRSSRIVSGRVVGAVNSLAVGRIEF